MWTRKLIMERLRKHARKGEKLEDAGRTFLEKYEKMKRR
jgi:hypothetical protein